MTGRCALVTGAAGFVGRHTVPALVAEGWQVDALDVKRASGWSWNTGVYDGAFTWVGVDVRDYFREQDDRYDLVVHLAANVGGRAVIDGSPLAVGLNLGIDSAMFEWAARTGQGRVLYFSSSAAYPVALQAKDVRINLRERHINVLEPGKPDATYGLAKVVGERLAAHARQAGVPVTVVRPFSGYGRDQDEAYPWPSFIRRAARRENPFPVWGDPTSERDWIHIDDVVAAALHLAEQGIDGPVNLGSGVGTTFADLAAVCCEIAGYSPEILPVDDAPQGVHRRVADVSWMREFYTPRESLHGQIAVAINAYRREHSIDQFLRPA